MTLICRFLLCLGLLAAAPIAGCTGDGRSGLRESDALHRYESTRICMGVKARMVVYAPDWPAAERAMGHAFDAIAALDASMSDYRTDSEVSALAANAGGSPVRVSPDLFRVLKRAREIAAMSDGAFDPTAGPLSVLWREARRRGEMPGQAEIGSARALVGWRGLELDERASTARLARAGMRIDLGGIAKGFAAQRAVETLKAEGIRSCLAALAGDACVGAAPPGQPGWIVEQGVGPPPHRMLRLVDACVSTSGDSEQYLQVGGTRYSHIIDPRTGLGVTSNAWASVVADRGADADALATAACVLGAVPGAELIRRVPGASAMIESDEAGPDGSIRRLHASVDTTGVLGRARVR